MVANVTEEPDAPMEMLAYAFACLCQVLCCVGVPLFVLLIIGFVVLRRRGAEKVTAKDAMNAGVESVSQVFVRGRGGGLEPADDDE